LKWLDTVRWAETNGFGLDQDRTHAWRYRDYVINAFNGDKTYDRFIKEQIAGDEMFPGNKEADRYGLPSRRVGARLEQSDGS
jgi:hypothetical protein